VASRNHLKIIRSVGSRLDSTATDEELVNACLRGEQAGWDALIERYAALVYSIPLKFGFGEADAADVFQSVCVTLLEKLDTIRAPGGLAAWIITTTSRQCLAVIRQQQRERARRSSSEVLFEGDGEPPDPELLPEDELVELERQHAVRLAVSQLQPPCRELIEALFSDTAERLSYDQLARRLAIAPNSLGPTRTRCLEKLRRLLRASGFAEMYE
jgi:RNA polymerase sigma factor (sigma-70 family)